PAQILPQELLPGMEISSAFLDGQFATYCVSGLEWMYSIGLFGVVAFTYGLAIRLWPMLPEEALAKDPTS
ncbi:MAG: molybdopterin oxidoreductase, partial [Nitrospinota bacterium]|nr:molybdopterin oxidoreductase [Nitrospinota bacterium]